MHRLASSVLFNAYPFLVVFLPLALLAHALAWRVGGARAAVGTLAAASLVFYGAWYPPYLALLGLSIAVNHALGRELVKPERAGRKALLGVGVAFNLGLLGWFKYANFLADNLGAAMGQDLGLAKIALPLAISFFTFQQIAYLVDASRGQLGPHAFLDYLVFVSFFPQLVAGPIVHHSELLPQVQGHRPPVALDRAAGITLFAIGLSKKVLIADAFADDADVFFDVAAAGRDPTFAQAFTGMMAYYVQLYFDFSGYSDMAIGLGRMFGFKLPANFDAPHRAADLAEMWRRWHITLSRFLRIYLYIPLGGNRVGALARYRNLFLTMLLGGVWHGAGWTYILCGTPHGTLLVAHTVWRKVTGGLPRHAAVHVLSVIFTQWVWLLTLVPFRSPDVDTTLRVGRAFLGFSPTGMGTFDNQEALPYILAAAAITWFAPTSQQWLRLADPVFDGFQDRLRPPDALLWRPNRSWALVTVVLLVLSVPYLERADAFLYWNF